MQISRKKIGKLQSMHNRYFISIYTLKNAWMFFFENDEFYFIQGLHFNA